MNKQQCLIAALALSGFLAPVAVRAQDDAEARARAVTLSGEAIAAKESGDLITAKAKLEEVLKLNPTDEGAKEVLSEVKRDILSKTEPVAAAPSTPIDIAAEKNLNLFREINRAILDAGDAANAGDFDGAVAILDGTVDAIPQNIAGQTYRDRITVARQEILAKRDSRSEGGLQTLARKAIKDQLALNKDNVIASRKLIAEADRQIKSRRLDDADASLFRAETLLPISNVADTTRVELKKERSRLIEARYVLALEARDIPAAAKAVDSYESLNGKSDRRAMAMRADFDAKQKDPHFKNIKELSPEFAAREKKAEELLTRARAQYLYGDYLGALETYKDVLQNQPYNTEAKSQSIHIREILHEKSGSYNNDVTKRKMLEAVDGTWSLPESFIKDSVVDKNTDTQSPLLARMKAIVIPDSITLRDMKLRNVLETLADQSRSYDKTGKGVNFNLIDPENKNPDVTLTVRGLSMDKILEQVLRSVNFSYVINGDVIEVRQDSGNNENETEEFSISPSAVNKMTNRITAAPAAAANNPFGGAGGGGTGAGGDDVSEALKQFFIASAGAEFDPAKFQSLRYDGSSTLFVTNKRSTLDRIRNQVRKYSDVKQVNIETKFIEVNQSDLNEIAANWVVRNSGLGGDQITGTTGNRTLDSAFRTSGGGNPGSIIIGASAGGTDANGNAIAATPGQITPIPNNSPSLPNQPQFGSGGAIGAFGSGSPSFAGTFTSTFGVGGYNVDLYLQALERTTGSDLMAAPHLTVKDGVPATIAIVQKLIYPSEYTVTPPQVSQSGGFGGVGNNSGGGGGASVALTAAAPSAFEKEDIGVTLTVTPKVQGDGSIDLDLEPVVTEFEGFVEYGGSSVAIAGNTTVTVPSGFYQPVFSYRRVKTTVTIYDGATIVIGGLTREEVKSIHDKVPVLGDLPLIGRLFQSNGKTSNKKNLMIFVTANMVTPSGSHLRSTIGGVKPGTTYQSPVLNSPAGPLYRSPLEAKDAGK